MKNTRFDDFVCVRAYVRIYQHIYINFNWYYRAESGFFPQYIHKYVASKRNKKQNKLSKTKTYNAVTSIKQI